jgi:hypothetical protein
LYTKTARRNRRATGGRIAVQLYGKAPRVYKNKSGSAPAKRSTQNLVCVAVGDPPQAEDSRLAPTLSSYTQRRTPRSVEARSSHFFLPPAMRASSSWSVSTAVPVSEV